MSVKGNDLIIEIEEYFKRVPKESYRSLGEIVHHLEIKFDQDISGGKSLKNQKRNINDKVRRALNNMPNINSTKESTSKKRYYWEDNLELFDVNLVYFHTFVQTELLGGAADIAKISQLLVEQEPFRNRLAFGPNLIESLATSASALNRKIIGEHPELFAFVPAPFMITENTTIMSIFENWYTRNPNWMGTKYYGFNGPRGLDSLMNNIGKMIKENQLSEVAETSRLGDEIKWLRINKERVTNKGIITLALLHLNRSLQGSIDL